MALLERFPHGLEFQCCEKLSPTSQYARKRAVERQITAFVVVLYSDPTPRYRTHINITTTATIKECIEALGETQWLA